MSTTKGGLSGNKRTRLMAVEPTTEWSRLVGGDVALDFANTALDPGPGGVDALADSATFLAWCAHASVAIADPAGVHADGTAADLAACRRLRAAILAIGTAHAAGAALPTAAVAELQSCYAEALRSASATETGPLVWSWSHHRPVRRATFLLADRAVELFRHGSLDRLKSCGSCGFLFLDASKNASRRWCSMDDCGKQSKIERYVAKRAAKRAAASPQR